MSTSAIRQALFTGIRTGRTLTMARAHMIYPPCNHPQQQQIRTFVPVFVPIYSWGSTPSKPKKDEEDYEQEFDFRRNPLFQSNPIGVNDQVNSGASTGTGHVPYKVRMLINGLSSTDRNIYKLTDPSLLPVDRQTIIKYYELPTFTMEELAQVRILMDQIGTQTEREYQQVNKLVHNKDSLINSADSDKVYTMIMSTLGTVLYGWLAYKGFFDNRYEPCATISRAFTEVLYAHNWFWIAPATGWLIAADTGKRQKKLTELYCTYTKDNYLTKYQYKLTLLNDLRKLFETPDKFMTGVSNSANCK